MAPIDTIVFDVGNVLIRWDPALLYTKLIPNAAERDWFLSTVCPPDWNLAQDRGRSFADGIAEATARHPAEAARIAAWFERWIEMVPSTVPGMAALFDRLRAAGYRIVGLTNFSAETWPIACAAHPILTRFDDVLVSGHVGRIKPEPEIYQLLFERCRVDPASAVFIDDSAANVAAAEALGMRSILFQGHDPLVAALATMGVRGAAD